MADPVSIERITSAFQSGDMARVIAQVEALPASARVDEIVLLAHGLALHAHSRHAEAAAALAQLVQIKPDVPDYWNNLAITAEQAGDLATAEHALQRAVALAPHEARFHHHLGLLLARQQRWPQARLEQFEAVRLAPGFGAARMQAALACHACGDLPGEEAMLDDVAHWPPQPAEQALMLATMLSSRGEQALAFDVLAHATDADTQTMAWRFTAMRAWLHERSNHLDDAEAALATLPLQRIAELPREQWIVRYEVGRARATVLARRGDHAGAARLLQHLLEHAADTEQRTAIAFALAAAQDKLKQHEQAWQSTQLAHTAQMQSLRNFVPKLMDENVQSLPMVNDRVTRLQRDRWTALPAPSSEQSPLFVVGFPRSGTTLLEQMIDAHPDFRSMDERPFIYDLIERMEHVGQTYPQGLAELTEEETRMLRQVYDGMVAKVAPDLGAARLVDKNPLNMLALPMIARLYPEARIILCLRHPCDVLMSCHMLPFRSPPFATLCSSLPRLARGYVQCFEQWFAHMEVFAPRVLEWRYESVVERFDEHLARLGHFLDISDTAPLTRYAEHARRKGFISTPSYAQVTQGINRASINRWHAWREHFQPVLPILQPMLERLGYEA